MAEPLTVDEAKEQLGLVADTSRDALIGRYISAARGFVENYTSHVLVQRQFTDWHDRWSAALRINRGPIVEVTEVSYTDSDGETAIYPDFVAITDRHPGLVYPSLTGWWPTLGRDGGIRVSYVAGYEPGDEPPELLQAMLLLVGHWWETRQTSANAAMVEAPFAVTALCDQYRVPVL